MRSSKLNFIVDITAFILFVFLVSTGVIMHYILPPGSGHHNTIWQMDRHGWGDIHFWISIGFLSILTYHLIRHWKWIALLVKGKERQNSGYRLFLGFVGFVALLAIAAAPILTPIKSSEGQEMEEFGSSMEEHAQKQIHGSMKLSEVEKISNVPITHLLRKLELPTDVSTTKTLRELKKEYGFEMDDVNRIIENYNSEDDHTE